MPHVAAERKAWLGRSSLSAIAALRAALIGATLIGAAAAPPVEAKPSRAATQSISQLGYKFYVGGVLVGKAWLSTRFEDGAYNSTATLETDGVAGWFVGANVRAEAVGAVDGDVRPGTLDVDGVTDGERWTMTIAYNGDAPGSVVAEPPFRKKAYEIDPTRQTGSLDPISAIIATFMPRRRGDACNRTIPIFDGRKRYDIIIGDQLEEEENDDGVKVVECVVRWKRVAGFKPKMMKKEDVFFTARFEIRDGWTVPTRLWADTEFGGAVAVIRR